ncbi:Crp/Fnr family transcriptional regulator [Pedobacter sp.]
MSSDLKYWYLHDHQLFRNLSFSEIDSLCILKKFKKSQKNELLDLPFSSKERIYFLKRGAIKLLRLNGDGEEILIDILQEGDVFGDLNLEMPTENDEFFKVVTEEAIICTFYRERLEEIMYKKPDFALNYIKFIGFNFKKIQNSYKNILFRDARTRLLLLLNMIIEKENIQSTSYQLPNYLTQKDISQLICTTRQTIISLFKTLEHEGLLSYSQKEIFIPDVKKIKNLAENVK